MGWWDSYHIFGSNFTWLLEQLLLPAFFPRSLDTVSRAMYIPARGSGRRYCVTHAHIYVLMCGGPHHRRSVQRPTQLHICNGLVLCPQEIAYNQRAFEKF